jgi:tryptophan synthase alpha chain
MRSIKQQIELIKQHKKIGVMTHVVAGYPSLDETEQLIEQMESAGVDSIEIQIPFSDPIADGPTIMKANDIALGNKVTVYDCLKLMSRVSKKVSIPLLFMGYYNSVFKYGVERFCRDAKEAGAQGVIIPDIPIDEEEHEQFITHCNTYDLFPIRVLSPTSTIERIASNIKVSKGFIYCTAISGTTGMRSSIDDQTQQFLRRMRKATDVPLAVGFGISRPEHIQSLIGLADIAVVGSAVIQKIEQGGVKSVSQYLELLVEARNFALNSRHKASENSSFSSHTKRF